MERPKLDQARAKIDAIDDELIRLLRQRLTAVTEIAAYKEQSGLAVNDKIREQEILRRAKAKLGEEYAPYGENFFRHLFALSRAYQKQKINAKQTEE